MDEGKEDPIKFDEAVFLKFLKDYGATAIDYSGYIGKEVVLDDKENFSSRILMVLECMHGHTFQTCWQDIMDGKWCNVCSDSRFVSKRRQDFEEALVGSEYDLLEMDKYGRGQVVCQGDVTHIKFLKVEEITKRCPECQLIEMNEFLEKRRYTWKIVDYNQNTNIGMFICKRGHTIHMSVNAMGTMCNDCTGSYGKTEKLKVNGETPVPPLTGAPSAADTSQIHQLFGSNTLTQRRTDNLRGKGSVKGSISAPTQIGVGEWNPFDSKKPPKRHNSAVRNWILRQGCEFRDIDTMYDIYMEKYPPEIRAKYADYSKKGDFDKSNNQNKKKKILDAIKTALDYIDKECNGTASLIGELDQLPRLIVEYLNMGIEFEGVSGLLIKMDILNDLEKHYKDGIPLTAECGETAASIVKIIDSFFQHVDNSSDRKNDDMVACVEGFNLGSDMKDSENTDDEIADGEYDDPPGYDPYALVGMSDVDDDDVGADVDFNPFDYVGGVGDDNNYDNNGMEDIAQYMSVSPSSDDTDFIDQYTSGMSNRELEKKIKELDDIIGEDNDSEEEEKDEMIGKTKKKLEYRSLCGNKPHSECIADSKRWFNAFWDEIPFEDYCIDGEKKEHFIKNNIHSDIIDAITKIVLV